MSGAALDVTLSRALRDLPHNYGYRYTKGAKRELLRILCTSLVGSDQNLSLLFPNKPPTDSTIDWSLRTAQNAIEGAEYTEARRGHNCGHIFKPGESNYQCRTCQTDETCVLCARCFAESDHEGHTVFVSLSSSNNGCCDCGDEEAWNRPLICGIHTADVKSKGQASGKLAAPASLPQHIVEFISLTIGKAMDYLCDVLACCPEQLRMQKTVDTVRADERRARLDPDKYHGEEPTQDISEYSLILWNDEKHTVDQVRDQVARACRKKKSFGKKAATEVDDIGRSIIEISTDITKLLDMARVLEQIKVSVTVRASRDTFRELMCETIFEWLSDIFECSVGQDHEILRHTICAQFFKTWSAGKSKTEASSRNSAIYDHELEEQAWQRRNAAFYQIIGINGNIAMIGPGDEDQDEDEDEEDEDDPADEEEEGVDLIDSPPIDHDPNDNGAGDAEVTGEGENPILRRALSVRRAYLRQVAVDIMDIEDEGGNLVVSPNDNQMDMDVDEEEDIANHVPEATVAAYSRPSLPSGQNVDTSRQASVSDSHELATSQELESTGTVIGSAKLPPIPKTPRGGSRSKNRPPRFWLNKPGNWTESTKSGSPENLNEKIRIDLLLMYDLRLWKTLRDTVRHLLISTVITEPEYKRLLAIRFAGLYTLLSQLYLVADREPDHSIINLSLQILTTPSLTAEVVERTNFLTHLMAVLYTFLTSRQVGYPREISPSATLAFDAGAIANRRMFHFFNDAKYIFQSPAVRGRLRTEPHYMQQFLDLVKVHQGICPYLRAVGDHVEYEADTWLSAGFIVKEIIRISRLVTDAFFPLGTETADQFLVALKEVFIVTTISSLGLECGRFDSCELRTPLAFSEAPLTGGDDPCMLPSIKVLNAHMSFYHPLHHITSWMLEAGKAMSREQLQTTLAIAMQHISGLKAKYPEAVANSGPFSASVKPDDWVSALFDPPLRVCVWLSQMRAGMWVRNGMGLRAQMQQYRSAQMRDMTYQRDILMLQAGLVLCDVGRAETGDKFLRQMISRFDLLNWVDGKVELSKDYENAQHMDVIEDFFQLLITLLTEREDLLPDNIDGKPSRRAIERDIAHILCFKAMSYSDLAVKLTDRITDADDFDDVLETMTNYKAPEGLNDHGVFDLKTEFAENIDPYYGFYTRNQREEADQIHRRLRAKKEGIDVAEVVPEPRLVPITSGLFKDLGAFTRTRVFVALLRAALRFATHGHERTTSVEKTRIEPVLQLVLHLTLLSIQEDSAANVVDGNREKGFVDQMVTPGHDVVSQSTTVPPARSESMLQLLKSILDIEEYSTCHPRVHRIIERAQQLRPGLFADHRSVDTESRTNASTPVSNVSADKEAKKKAALERQARVMAQFKAQQNSFLSNQGMDWDIDDSGDEHDGMEDIKVDDTKTETTREWPVDACILCQEDASDDRLYGCFAFISESGIQRQTPAHDLDHVQEVLHTPENLDRSAEAVRPVGKALQNKHSVEKRAADGTVTRHEKQTLGRTFDWFEHILHDNVVTSCGHMMHYSCLDTYLVATQRRQAQQISRNHPERLDRKEFLCPLCKALGNVFLPLIWNPRKESYPGLLGQASQPFDEWLSGDISSLEHYIETAEAVVDSSIWISGKTSLAQHYIRTTFKPTLASQVLLEASPQSPRFEADRRRSNPLASIFDLRRLSASVPMTNSPSTTGSELTKAYSALKDSVETNCFNEFDIRLRQEASQSRLCCTMLQSVASSIAAVEIQHRGTASQHSLLTGIPEQTLTNLRVYCETVASLLAMEQLKEPDRVAAQLLKTGVFSTGVLLGVDDGLDGFTPLVYNVFWAVTLSSFLLPQSDWQKHGHNLIQLGLLAEVVKAVMLYTESGVLSGAPAASTNAADPVFTAFLETLRDVVARGKNEGTKEMVARGEAQGETEGIKEDPKITPAFAQQMETLVRRHALVYLRKILILTHVRCGVDYSVASTTLDSEAPELERLCTLLRIPSLTSLLGAFTSQNAAGESMRRVATRWSLKNHQRQSTYPLPIRLDHPVIFELVSLPRTFDSLSEEAVKRRCPTTGKAVGDPVVCLLCGAIFCSQSNCCRDRLTGLGGANRHRLECGFNIGLFINIRKCMVVFLHDHNGGWAQAPYLDRYGEADPTMRRHHQLFLNQKRYDRLLRDAWLGHGVPSVISRKLEADNNNGGWETL